MHTTIRGLAAALLILSLAGSCSAAGGEAFTDPAQAGPDFQIQGEYQGELSIDGANAQHGLQVIAKGDGKFQAVLYHGGLPGQGFEPGGTREKAEGQTEGNVTKLTSERWTATIEGNVATVADSGGNKLGQLQRVNRESSTLGAKPPEGAVILFDGTNGDQFEDAKLTEDKLLIAGAKTKQSFQDWHLHLEFRTPFMPASEGQARGNSGVYLNHRYEVQVLDSFGLEGKNNECGGIYSVQDPRLNMCYPPLSWQTYDIDFVAARFDDQGQRTSNAVVTVRLNGVPVYENFTLPGLTPGGASQEAPGSGPLYLQDHGNPVHFRNIWLVEGRPEGLATEGAAKTN